MADEIERGSTHGGVIAGVWMYGPEDAEIMERAMESRLRNIGADHPDRLKLEQWRREAMNLLHRARGDDWGGWRAKP